MPRSRSPLQEKKTFSSRSQLKWSPGGPASCRVELQSGLLKRHPSVPVRKNSSAWCLASCRFATVPPCPLAHAPASRRAQVTASAAHKRRITADKKVANNVNRRGLVPDNAAERRKGTSSLGPLILGFFFVVIIGSSILQIYQTANRKR